MKELAGMEITSDKLRRKTSDEARDADTWGTSAETFTESANLGVIVEDMEAQSQEEDVFEYTPLWYSKPANNHAADKEVEGNDSNAGPSYVPPATPFFVRIQWSLLRIMLVCVLLAVKVHLLLWLFTIWVSLSKIIKIDPQYFPFH